MARSSSVNAKLDRYSGFWNRSPVERPLIGFSVGGWFPLQSYRAMQKLRGKSGLAPAVGLVRAQHATTGPYAGGYLPLLPRSLHDPPATVGSPHGRSLPVCRHPPPFVVETAAEASRLQEFFAPWV